MKQLLLFSTFILFSMSIYSQVQGPPPPCGITPVYVCDDNEDGLAVLNLRELFPFSTFCAANNGEVESDYNPISYYLSQEDMNNQVNAIANPEAYINISNPQNIYYRANAKVSGGSFEFLSSADNFIEIISYQKINLPSPLVLCDVNSNGKNIFELKKKDSEILTGLDPNKYGVKYFESFVDAQNIVNELPKDSYTNISNPQTVFVRVEHISSFGCENIAELDLIVQDLCQDIAVYLVSHVPPRPGFDYVNYLIIQNKGLETVSSGSVEFVHDASITFNNVTNIDTGNSVTNTATGFTLDFVNLAPDQHETVLINMNVPVSTSLGALLTNTATYSVTDLSVENNTSALSETVIGSYDPNDILESHGPEILYSSFESTDYLYYTVRFQNVGTADAINVSIDNTLDSRLDKSTIQMLSSSHSNVFTRTDSQLNWKFDNIHLPSEDMDEPNSHGYVYYKIKPLAGYKVGDIIPNTAEIYFDFNPAVVTNTFQTEFVTTLSNKKFNSSYFELFPNPANNYVELKLNKSLSENIEISMYDIQGKQVEIASKKLGNKHFKLNVSKLSKGLYFVKINDGAAESVRKLVVN